MILHLGVIDLAYAHSGVTTGDVAEWLEKRYHIMESFYTIHEDEIAQEIVDGLAGTIESLSLGAPPTIDPFGEATSAIKDMFSKFLESREMDGVGYSKIPTVASGGTSKRKGGINHRLKHPYKMSNPVRPSFIDTSLFESSFTAWVD